MTPQTLRFPGSVKGRSSENQSQNACPEARITGNGSCFHVIFINGLIVSGAVFISAAPRTGAVSAAVAAVVGRISRGTYRNQRGREGQVVRGLAVSGDLGPV